MKYIFITYIISCTCIINKSKSLINQIYNCLVLMPIFANAYPKAHEEESPMKSKAQRPTKKTKEQERSKERNSRESNL